MRAARSAYAPAAKFSTVCRPLGTCQQGAARVGGRWEEGGLACRTPTGAPHGHARRRHGGSMAVAWRPHAGRMATRRVARMRLAARRCGVARGRPCVPALDGHHVMRLGGRLLFVKATQVHLRGHPGAGQQGDGSWQCRWACRQSGPASCSRRRPGAQATQAASAPVAGARHCCLPPGGGPCCLLSPVQGGTAPSTCGRGPPASSHPRCAPPSASCAWRTG